MFVSNLSAEFAVVVRSRARLGRVPHAICGMSVRCCNVRGVPERGCECGANWACAPVWHEALAAEQADPAMAIWHNPLVCAFLLQHRSQFRPRFADGQYRFLQLFVDRGIDAVNAMAKNRRARNRGSRPDFDDSELNRYEAIPLPGFPTAFAVSIHHLREPTGGFVAQGYAPYGERLRDFAHATIEGWTLLREPAQRR